MPRETDEYFAASATEEERRQNLQAMGAGFHAVLQDLVRRVSSYCDLLELEMEDRPAGALYLKDTAASLRQAEHLLAVYRRVLAADQPAPEDFDLKALVRGVAARLKKIELAEIAVDDSAAGGASAFVQGKLVLLHQALFDLARLVGSAAGGSGGPARLRLTLAPAHCEADLLKARKSALPHGDYYQLALGPADRPLGTDGLITLHEKLCLTPSVEMDERLLYVLGVVGEHGGDLFAPKDAPQLASLVLLLPVRRNRVAMFGEASLADEQALHGQETILLVDDEGIIWDVVIDMLQGLGYTVILAADGKECVEIYRSNPGGIDLVLLDMVMPEMNGHDAFFALKQIDPKVKVLLQSGYVNEEDARAVLNAGALGFLRKPYRTVDLARRIRDALGHK